MVTPFLTKKPKPSSRKKKALKIITILIVLILISMIAWIIYTIAKNPLLVSQDSFIVEYGNEISVNPSDYLSEQVKKEIITKTKVNVNTNSRDEKNQYPVGEYEVILNYIHHKAIAIVIVKDTTCPQIKIPQSPIEIEEGKLSTDDFKVPSSLYLTYTRPLAPIWGRFTNSVSSSSCLRVYEAHPAAQIAPMYSAELNTAKSLCRACWVRSVNFMSKRRSGLSHP